MATRRSTRQRVLNSLSSSETETPGSSASYTGFGSSGPVAPGSQESAGKTFYNNNNNRSNNNDGDGKSSSGANTTFAGATTNISSLHPSSDAESASAVQTPASGASASPAHTLSPYVSPYVSPYTSATGGNAQGRKRRKSVSVVGGRKSKLPKVDGDFMLPPSISGAHSASNSVSSFASSVISGGAPGNVSAAVENAHSPAYGSANKIAGRHASVHHMPRAELDFPKSDVTLKGMMQMPGSSVPVTVPVGDLSAAYRNRDNSVYNNHSVSSFSSYSTDVSGATFGTNMSSVTISNASANNDCNDGLAADPTIHSTSPATTPQFTPATTTSGATTPGSDTPKYTLPILPPPSTPSLNFQVDQNSCQSKYNKQQQQLQQHSARGHSRGRLSRSNSAHGAGSSGNANSSNSSVKGRSPALCPFPTTPNNSPAIPGMPYSDNGGGLPPMIPPPLPPSSLAFSPATGGAVTRSSARSRSLSLPHPDLRTELRSELHAELYLEAHPRESPTGNHGTQPSIASGVASTIAPTIAPTIASTTPTSSLLGSAPCAALAQMRPSPRTSSPPPKELPDLSGKPNSPLPRGLDLPGHGRGYGQQYGRGNGQSSGDRQDNVGLDLPPTAPAPSSDHTLLSPGTLPGRLLSDWTTLFEDLPDLPYDNASFSQLSTSLPFDFDFANHSRSHTPASSDPSCTSESASSPHRDFGSYSNYGRGSALDGLEAFDRYLPPTSTVGSVSSLSRSLVGKILPKFEPLPLQSPSTSMHTPAPSQKLVESSRGQQESNSSKVSSHLVPHLVPALAATTAPPPGGGSVGQVDVTGCHVEKMNATSSPNASGGSGSANSSNISSGPQSLQSSQESRDSKDPVNDKEENKNLVSSGIGGMGKGVAAAPAIRVRLSAKPISFTTPAPVLPAATASVAAVESFAPKTSSPPLPIHSTLLDKNNNTTAIPTNMPPIPAPRVNIRLSAVSSSVWQQRASAITAVQPTSAHSLAFISDTPTSSNVDATSNANPIVQTTDSSTTINNATSGPVHLHTPEIPYLKTDSADDLLVELLSSDSMPSQHGHAGRVSQEGRSKSVDLGGIGSGDSGSESPSEALLAKGQDGSLPRHHISPLASPNSLSFTCYTNPLGTPMANSMYAYQGRRDRFNCVSGAGVGVNMGASSSNGSGNGAGIGAGFEQWRTFFVVSPTSTAATPTSPVTSPLPLLPLLP